VVVEVAMDGAEDAEFSDFMHGRYFSCRPGTQGVWFAAAAQPDVATVLFSLSDGGSLRVPVVGIAGGGKAYVFAVANGVRLLSWTALDAAGRQAGTGAGWKCG
jgi:hypothetical protein